MSSIKLKSKIMRYFTFIILAAAATCGAVDEKPKSPVDASRPNSGNEPSLEEVQTMRKILELPPERLAKMRSAMERIERMSPEERKDFAATLAKLENASPEERKKVLKDMREKSGPGGLGAKVFEYHLKQLSGDEAKQERANFLKLSSDERQQYIRKLLEKYSAELPKIRADGKSKDKDKDGDKEKDKDKDGDGNKDGERPAHRRPPAEAPPAQ
ncbi:hypothetical protein EBZ97_00700 [bacterium]|jgi:hypothetical protein|nr:hypothetical protein [bacterium]